MKTHNGKWIGLVLHHTGASQLDSVQSIRRIHKEVNGWGDIGYHYLAEIKNNHAYCKKGRDTKYNGAHAGVDYYNNNYLGLCIAGNYEISKMTDSIYNDYIGIICDLIKKFNLKYVVGHKEVKATACPGKNINLSKVRDDVNKRLKESGSHIQITMK